MRREQFADLIFNPGTWDGDVTEVQVDRFSGHAVTGTLGREALASLFVMADGDDVIVIQSVGETATSEIGQAIVDSLRFDGF